MPIPTIFFRDALRYTGKECLLWPFAIGSAGYPKVSIGQHAKSRDAHRWLCELAYGPAPTPQHVAAHHCGQKLCLNPGHIRWATQTENMADKIIHKTNHAKETHPRRKLTNDAVRDIRESKGPLKEAAKKYGVHFSTISSIRLGKHWKHV
jgi:hypothetical protein